MCQKPCCLRNGRKCSDMCFAVKYLRNGLTGIHEPRLGIRENGPRGHVACTVVVMKSEKRKV